MLGNWSGYYKYSLPQAQRAIGFEQTYFTICITSFDGEFFSGTVKDDTNTGGMEGEGVIKGSIKNGKIVFEKHMPKRVQIIDRQGTRKTLEERHPTLYYAGAFSIVNEQIEGKWKFNYRLVLLLGFIPIIYRPGKGAFTMHKILS